MIYGYCRVSTKEQNLDRQIKALVDKGVKPENIITDKASGKDFDRAGYIKLKTKLLKSGDTLVVKELDRLGRNKDDIKAELDYFETNKIRIKILNIPTTLMDLPKENEWVLEMINNILVEVLGAIAEEERNKIKQRQAEGIATAKEKGVKFGREKRSLETLPKDFEKVYRKLKKKSSKGVLTIDEGAKILGISRMTFYRYIKLYEEK